MNKKCEICGKAYEYCPNCPRDMYKPTWMNRYHDERCKKLWDTLSANGIGDITATEALKRLQDIDYKTIDVKIDALKGHIALIEDQAMTEMYAADDAAEAETAEVAEVTDDTTVTDVADDANVTDVTDDALEDVLKGIEAVPVTPKKRRGFKH